MLSITSLNYKDLNLIQQSSSIYYDCTRNNVINNGNIYYNEMLKLKLTVITARLLVYKPVKIHIGKYNLVGMPPMTNIIPHSCPIYPGKLQNHSHSTRAF